MPKTRSRRTQAPSPASPRFSAVSARSVRFTVTSMFYVPVFDSRDSALLLVKHQAILVITSNKKPPLVRAAKGATWGILLVMACPANAGCS